MAGKVKLLSLKGIISKQYVKEFHMWCKSRGARVLLVTALFTFRAFCFPAMADDIPTKGAVEAALRDKLPPYWTINNLDVSKKSDLFSRSEDIPLLCALFGGCPAQGPSQPFLRTPFVATVSSDDNLFQQTGTSCSRPVISQTVSRGAALEVSGVAATFEDPNLGPVTRVMQLISFLPVGVPRSGYYQPLLKGSAEEQQCTREAAKTRDENLLAIKNTILGQWKGHYECPRQSRTMDTVMQFQEMDDNGHINGTLTWLNISGTTTSCTEKLGGDYDTNGGKVHFNLLGLINPPPTCQGVVGKGFSAQIAQGQRKLTFTLDPGAFCDHIYVDKQ